MKQHPNLGQMTDQLRSLTERVEELESSASGSGLVLLSSGTISSPIASVEISLPGDYFHYELRTHGLLDNSAVDTFPNFCVQVSQDGATYFTGGADYKTLLSDWYKSESDASNLVNLVIGNKGNLSYNGQNGASANYALMYINPGSATKKPIIYGRALYDSGFPDAINFDVIVDGATARLQKIKFFNSDGSNIIGGGYVLFGVPVE